MAHFGLIREHRTQEVGGSNPPSSIKVSLQSAAFRLTSECFVVILDHGSQP
jgi:hypothetical protein